MRQKRSKTHSTLKVMEECNGKSEYVNMRMPKETARLKRLVNTIAPEKCYLVNRVIRLKGGKTEIRHFNIVADSTTQAALIADELKWDLEKDLPSVNFTPIHLKR